LASLPSYRLVLGVMQGCAPEVFGASDEVGWKAKQQVVSAHDLHATILHLLGIDHKRLTYFFNGRNMRLTDVAGESIPQITS
jgi:hypothetical protein